MKQIRKTVRIQAPSSRVFEYITQPSNFLEVWPSMVEVSNAKRAADGTNSFDWVYKMGGMHHRGHAESKKVTTNQYLEVHNTGSIPSTFRWNLRGRDDTTDVTLEIEYDIPIPLLGKFAESFLIKLNDREADALLANLKERLDVTQRSSIPTGAPAH